MFKDPSPTLPFLFFFIKTVRVHDKMNYLRMHSIPFFKDMYSSKRLCLCKFLLETKYCKCL